MLGAGTVINPLIKIVTTVVVLGASYLFIVKPILDTTDDVIDQTSASVRAGAQQSQQALHDANVQSARSRAGSYRDSLRGSWPAAAREVTTCVRDAGDELKPLNRCVNVAQRLVHGVQSDRAFALAYADSLAARGDGVGAERVRDCVKDAGFGPAPMHRCRNLADQLLFG